MTFPNGNAYLINELTPLRYRQILNVVTETLKGMKITLDVNSDTDLATALARYPKEVMGPVLKALLVDPLLGDRPDKEHITIEEISNLEFNYLVAVARGVLPEMVDTFRPKYDITSRNTSSKT